VSAGTPTAIIFPEKARLSGFPGAVTGRVLVETTGAFSSATAMVALPLKIAVAFDIVAIYTTLDSSVVNTKER
jgi:hypothetical protein